MRWIVLTLVGAFTFCNVLATGNENLTEHTTEDPELKVSIIPDSDTKLSLRYTLINTLEHDIYVFTPILTYDRQQQKRLPDPGRVYVSWQTDTNHNMVRLSKQLWPIPERLQVYVPEVPHLTRLVPGDVLEEDLSIEIPLKIDYPYMSAFSKKKRGSLPIQTSVNAIVFAIGYVSGEPKALRLEPTAAGTYTIPYGIGTTYQKLVERKFDVRVSVVE